MEQWHHIIWTVPAVIFSSLIIGWGAETAALFISQGIALAILAWLQTFPEFAVEAVIAWQQRQELMIANLTGSLRLLVGLGWPLIYFTSAFFGRKAKGKWPVIKLKTQNILEVYTLLFATIYFLFIWLKDTLTVFDSFSLFLIYTVYLYQLSKMPAADHEETEDLPWISKKIIPLAKVPRVLGIVGLFVFGGVILEFSVDPFLHSLEALAALFGISSFFFIQWCAPFVSEFPEKVTAFQWARRASKVTMALLNMVSSNIVQWTIMAGMLPIIYSYSKGEFTAITFNALQENEILLTVLQSFLSVLFLIDLEFGLQDALGLFILWLVQFIFPTAREYVISAYGLWMIFEIYRLLKSEKIFMTLKRFKNKE